MYNVTTERDNTSDEPKNRKHDYDLSHKTI